jgi:hypothetical protein
MTKSINGFRKITPRPSRLAASVVNAGTLAPVESISAATPLPPISALAADESKQADVESRGQRLAGDLIEQRHGNISVMVAFLGLIVLFFYATFLITAWCLFLSQVAFRQPIPVSGMVLLGLTGSIPTILSISLLVGLFSHKEGKDKEKDEKSSTPDWTTISKIIAESLKHLKSI